MRARIVRAGNQMVTISLIIISLVLFSNFTFGQTDRNYLIKAGGFLYFLESGDNGYSLHLEYERAFENLQFLTFGPRIDYTEFKYSTGALMIAYDLKLYPFYWFSKKPYRGIFLGADVTYLIHNKDINESRYGPGIGSLFGYQHVFKEKVSLCLEGSMAYVQDLNKESRRRNSKHQYLYVFACIKVGLRINKKVPVLMK